MEDFIRTVLGDLSGYAFVSRASGRTANGKLNVNIHKAFKYPDQIEEMIAYAGEHSTEDVYLSPLLYGDKRNDKGNIARTPENALTSKTIYMDSDLCAPDKFRLQPSIHVVTSRGRGHDYWLLDEPVEAKRAAEVAHKITTAHKDDGCDPSGWSANKVLRLPNTVNTSHGFPESVVAEYSGIVYNIMDIEGAYDDVEIIERPIMGRETEVQIATPKALPDYSDALAKLPENALNIALAEPKVGPDGNRSEARYRLLCELFRLEGVITQEEALSIAWNAPASRKWSQEDIRGIDGLIAEANKAYSEVQWEKGQGLEPPELNTTEGNIDLLAGDEREVLKHHATWVDQYIDWAGRKMAKQNPPYDRINAWTVLSCAFSDMAFIPRKNGPEGLNLYTMTLGETTTGKSQSLKMMRTVLDEVFAEDPGYNLGGNASPNALGEKLLERDGKVSFFNKDEAHGLFKQWATQDWTSGMMEDLALLYDGTVPPMLRVGKKEMSKPAKTQFVMHLMGTPEEIARSLNRDMFKSGFLARFMWTIGEPRTLTKDAVVEEDSDGTEIRLGFEPMARQWGAEFAEIKRQLRSDVSSSKVSIGITKQAADRMTRVKWDLVNLVKKSDANFDIINPSLVRMGVTIRKCATLLAVSDGRKETELIDVLKAIEAAEEWVKNLLIVARQINASDFERSCDEVEAFVRSKDDRVKLEFVNRRFKAWRVRDLQEAIGALASQGRIKEVSEAGGKWLAINKKD
jgi:hypothetical protein